MSHDIVIVPTYDRPEFLRVCLEKLNVASTMQRVWVCEDDHVPGKSKQTQLEIDQVLWEAADMFGDRFTHLAQAPHSSYGNSRNVLEAFRLAAASNARYVYLVEDDVMVMPDFFQWHEAAQQKFGPFVSCAGRINRSLNFAMNGPEAIDESIKDPLACVASPSAYGSWAACFTRKVLHDFVVPYSQECFYKTITPGHEQDIIIQKQMQVVHPSGLKHFSVWPYVPRAYHMGWYSYHRTAGMKFNGTLTEKVAALRGALSDPQKIREMACLQEIDPYPAVPTPVWQSELYLKSDFRR